MNLISNTYWTGTPFNMRRVPEDARADALLLRAADGREHAGLLWTSARHARPRTGAVVMHPRADFTRHYVIPRLVEAGVAVLAANTRNPNNDATTVHEEIVLDVGSCVAHLKNVRGVDKIVLIGNSGGGALNGFYQAQAKLAKGQRLAVTPGGRRTRLNESEMIPADAMIYIAAHKGEGMIMNEVIDPSVVDEADPHRTASALDMYDPANGFVTPSALDGSDARWCRYDDAFVARYRAAQIARVARIDESARELIADNRRAEALHGDPDFAGLPDDRRREILRREAFEPLLVVYRTMANLHYVDNHLDPSNRDYGSLMSPRPDLMNWKLFGFGRYTTPHAWLSTWSGLSSQASLMRDLPRIGEPTLFVNAGKDQEIYPSGDARAMFDAVASADKTFAEFPDAQHYFNPPFGRKDAPDVEALMDVIVPWILERFGA